MQGKLYIVPSPIGNLGDITFRAIEVLKSVDVILAEDTRQSVKLLKHYDITNPLQSYHQHNEHKVLNRWVQALEEGQQIAVLSDAGTPGISDPGFLLIRACREHNIDVEVLPGATALITAIVGSGIPCDRFVFEGFLPPKKGRQTRLLLLAEEQRTVVFYESPHKLLKTLGQVVEYFGPDRPVVVARELTKIHEEYWQGTASEAVAEFTARQPKGEIVLVVGGK